MKRYPLPLLLLLLAANAAFCQLPANWQEMPGWKARFDAFGVEGSMLVYSQKEDRWLVHNPARAAVGYLPASTFKILNTLIGLETGVLKSPQTLLPWNGTAHWNENWNRDLTLQEAFAVSCVPCYREIARQIGLERMQEGVSKAGYGRMDISAASLDLFWLQGNSRISSREQIDFLSRLQAGRLPFSAGSLALLKEIMLRPDGRPEKTYAKTGMVEQDGRHIGWYVGWVETADNTYFFALNIEKGAGEKNDRFLEARIAIADQLVSEVLAF